MSAIRLTAAAVAISAALLTAPSALANHTTSATASISMDPAPASSVQYEKSTRSKCSGSRVVRVAWTTACPGVESATIHYWSPTISGTRRIHLEDDVPDEEDATSGCPSCASRRL